MVKPKTYPSYLSSALYSNSFKQKNEIKVKEILALILITIISYLFLIIIHELGHCLVLLIFQYEFTINFSFTGIIFTPYIEPVRDFDHIYIKMLFFAGGFLIQVVFVFLCLFLLSNKKTKRSFVNKILIIQILLHSRSFLSYFFTDLIFLKIGDFYILLDKFPLFFYLLITLIEILFIYIIYTFKKLFIPN